MPRGKQGPAGVELTQQLEELNGTERECRVIYDAEAAGKAGMRTIGVLCGGFSEETLRKAGCIAIYKDPADLLARYDESPLVCDVVSG